MLTGWTWWTEEKYIMEKEGWKEEEQTKGMWEDDGRKEWRRENQVEQEQTEIEEGKKKEKEEKKDKKRTEERKERETRHKMALASRVNREKG